ncbi:glycosyltransferase family 2 protein [Uruburuella testudinis]|uniref:Glycosyltransferase family 2 protein n=1 Tax=Uruburuella testudinis TaxID=1282863 RepID=A0ABY4DQD6_9NEIS|nr:glycosyltransferase family 2 protein [Uruburuella testudinis]UOO81250.1 glycosyltransferase family 2 protein [Uruburuella testudinis]
MNTIYPSLTIALITKNEAANLEACLQSTAGLTDKIVIIDSGSSDATADIANRYGAAFHRHEDWPGFGRQRNRAHQYIETDWVLWLDADERLTPELNQSIQTALKQTPADGKTAFSFNRLSNTFGAFIRHCGWYPDWVVRLYPTAHARYSDDLVHEKVLLPADTQVKKLQGDALHYTYATLDQFLAKQNLYGRLWAEQRLAKGKTASLSQAMVHGAGSFIKMYILKAGFLDGRHGLLLSILLAQATFNKYAALWLAGKK